MINGEDRTEELFVQEEGNANNNEEERDEENSRYYVNCIGHSACRDAIITDCPRIKCVESEACNNAVISNFTESVLCEGLHSCHRTNITVASATESNTGETKVLCVGSSACDVAQISGADDGSTMIDEIKFVGVKAGRKVHVENAKLIKCQDGKDTTKACDSLSTFRNVQCLYCGKDGCADHINTCRYKLWDENQDGNDEDANQENFVTYEKCIPETVTGVGDYCPAGLEEELRMELNGEVQMGEVVVTSSSSSSEENTGGGDRRKTKRKNRRGSIRG